MIKGMTLGTRGGKLSLLLGLTLGIVAAALIVVYLQGANEDSGGSSSGISGDTVPVVVAAQDIKAGTRLTAEMITVKQVPPDVALLNVFTSTEELVGMVPIVDILAGEQLVNTRVLTATDAGQIIEATALADTVPITKDAVPCATGNCGLRALSIQVSPATAAAGLVRAGDRVDIIASFEDGSAITVVTDVEVLALERDFQRVATTGEDGADRAVLEEGDEKPEATVATVALWPEEAMKVAAAEDMAMRNDLCEGTLRLSLRHTGQQGTFDVPIGQGVCAQLFASSWGLAAEQ